jgi:hypothetical protein
MNVMDTLSSIFLGIGLSAACGFRVFVPLLIMSIASLTGHMTLSSGFDWIGTYPALAAFGAATVLEVAGYYLPWIDNLLDTIATPSAVVAGTIVMASAVSEMSPLMQWSLAIVAGGGTSAMVQGVTSLTRGASSLTTGGLGNPIVSTMEMGGATLLSVLAVALPMFAGIVVIGVLVFAARKLFGKRHITKEGSY